MAKIHFRLTGVYTHSSYGMVPVGALVRDSGNNFAIKIAENYPWKWLSEGKVYDWLLSLNLPIANNCSDLGSDTLISEPDAFKDVNIVYEGKTGEMYFAETNTEEYKKMKEFGTF